MQAVSLVSGHETPRTAMHSVGQPVADQCADPVIIGAEAPELDLLCVLNILGITVTPFHGYLGVSIGVDENVECAVAVEDREECDRGSDLAENGLDLLLDFLVGFLNGLGGWGVADSVAFRQTGLARHEVAGQMKSFSKDGKSVFTQVRHSRYHRPCKNSNS